MYMALCKSLHMFVFFIRFWSRLWLTILKLCSSISKVLCWLRSVIWVVIMNFFFHLQLSKLRPCAKMDLYLELSTILFIKARIKKKTLSTSGTQWGTAMTLPTFWGVHGIITAWRILNVSACFPVNLCLLLYHIQHNSSCFWCCCCCFYITKHFFLYLEFFLQGFVDFINNTESIYSSYGIS